MFFFLFVFIQLISCALEFFEDYKIQCQTCGEGSGFGFSVALSEIEGTALLLVSAIQIETVFLYSLPSNSTWKLNETFVSQGYSYEYFGIRVAISKKKVLIGSVGAANFFSFQIDGSWQYDGSHLTHYPDDRFGSAVALSEDGSVALVGAEHDSLLPYQGGAAYILYWDGTRYWSEVKELRASDASSFDFFGHALALSDGGDWAVVSAVGDFGDGYLHGSAYVFERGEGGEENWGQVTKLESSRMDSLYGSDYTNNFGQQVSISGEAVLIGAIFYILNEGGAFLYRERDFLDDSKFDVLKSEFPSSYLFGKDCAVSLPLNSAIITGSDSSRLFCGGKNDSFYWEEVASLRTSAVPLLDQVPQSVALSRSGGSSIIAVGVDMNDTVFIYDFTKHLQLFDGTLCSFGPPGYAPPGNMSGNDSMSGNNDDSAADNGLSALEIALIAANSAFFGILCSLSCLLLICFLFCCVWISFFAVFIIIFLSVALILSAVVNFGIAFFAKSFFLRKIVLKNGKKHPEFGSETSDF